MDKGGRVPALAPVYPNCPICPRPELTPENEMVWATYVVAMLNPLIAPMGGVVGMDFSVLPFIFRMMCIPEARWPELFSRLLIIEEIAAKARNAEADLERKRNPPPPPPRSRPR